MVASCGAANTAKLLLRSANDRQPNGLANASDQVGRNYTFHNSQAVLALSVEENPTVFQKTLGVNDFYLRGTDDFDYPMGNIQMVGKSSAPMYRGEKPLETKLAPTRTLEDMARHAVDFWLSTEDLPRAENRVTVDREGRLTLSYTASNDESKKRLFHQLKSMLGQIGMHPDHLVGRHAYLKNEIPVAGVAHQAGTCRFGTDPSSSVLDTDCRDPRARQPLRRRLELLPQHRRRQPGADRDGERGPGRRPPARASRRSQRRLMDAADRQRPRVLILGAGFGGLGAARKLKKADADVVIVDHNDFHTFQPMLYQLATAVIETTAVAHPVRDLFHDQENATVHQATATAIDLEKREVEFEQMEPHRLRLPGPRPRRARQLLRRRGSGRARVPDVHPPMTRCASRSTCCDVGRRRTAIRR